MFCSFEKVPRILRLFCRGRVTEFWEDGFGEATRSMGVEVPVGARAVIELEIFKVCFFFSPAIFPMSSFPCAILLIHTLYMKIKSFALRTKHC
jgi:hypothetical protein